MPAVKCWISMEIAADIIYSGPGVPAAVRDYTPERKIK
jgi:hypothetical protein